MKLMVLKGETIWANRLSQPPPASQAGPSLQAEACYLSLYPVWLYPVWPYPGRS